MKIIQKLRERPAGVDVVGLALGESGASDVITVGYNKLYTNKLKYNKYDMEDVIWKMIYVNLVGSL